MRNPFRKEAVDPPTTPIPVHQPKTAKTQTCGHCFGRSVGKIPITCGPCGGTGRETVWTNG